MRAIFNITSFAAKFAMVWDAWNRLIHVQGGPNNIDISYAYDGLNRRITQTVTQGAAPSLDFYYNSNWKIIEERDATGAIFLNIGL